jgi:hypothetical protein
MTHQLSSEWPHIPEELKPVLRTPPALEHVETARAEIEDRSWLGAAGAERISSLVAIGEPAIALPGVRVRMPLSLLAVRGLGVAVLARPVRAPSIGACSPEASVTRRLPRHRIP